MRYSHTIVISIYFALLVNRKRTIPSIPAIKEEIKIINLELSIIKELSNANKVTKIDIVNPIPPRIETANN